LPCVALRAVTSTDGMSADYFPFPHEFLSRSATRIINEVPGIKPAVYNVTSPSHRMDLRFALQKRSLQHALINVFASAGPLSATQPPSVSVTPALCNNGFAASE